METRLSKKRKLESEEQEITFSTNLFDLPMEMLLYLGKFLELEHIFKFRCCSRFARDLGNIMLSDLRELEFDYNFPKNVIQLRQLRVILQQCHRLRKISIILDVEDEDKCFLTVEIVENLLSNNPLLKEIVLYVFDVTGITSKALVLLATKCKNLEKLAILSFYPGNEFLETFSAHNNQLVEVEFDFDLSTEYWKNIREFLKNQPRLQRITLPDLPDNLTSSIGELSIYGMYGKILLTIAEFCKELISLRNFGGKNIYALRKIVENCPKLDNIEFSYLEIVSDEMLSYLNSKSIDVYGGGSESDLDCDLDDEDDSDDPYWNSDEFSDDSPQDYDSDQD